MTKEEDRKRRKKRLLIEPPALPALRKVNHISDNDAGDHQQHQHHDENKKNVIDERQKSCESTRNGSRGQQKNELSSLLSILFGVMLLILSLQFSGAQLGQRIGSPAQTSTTMMALFNQSSSSAQVSASNMSLIPMRTTTKPAPGDNSEATTTTIMTTTIMAETLPEYDSSEAGDEEENVSPGGNKLNELLLGVAGETADRLIVRGQSGAINDQPAEGAEEEKDIERLDEVRSDRASAGLQSNSSSALREAEEAELKLALDTYAKWRATGDDLIELFSRKLMPVIIEHGYEVDPVTVTGLLQVFNAIRALKPWALKLLDASAKLAPGLLIGTQSDFGDFDECLNVRVDDPSGLASDSDAELDPETGLRSSTVIGRYCLADIEFPKPPRSRLAKHDEELHTDWAPIELRRPLLDFNKSAAFKDTIFVETGNFLHMLYVDPVRVGICLTNKIDPDSFAKLLNKLIEDSRVSISFKSRCVTKYDRLEWSIQQVVSAWVLICASGLVLLSTGFELLLTKVYKLPLPARLDPVRISSHRLLRRYQLVLTSFSIMRNTKRLFKPQRPSSAAARPQVYGANLSAVANELNSNLSYALAGSQSSSSLESSPSIDRRSSIASSAADLIAATCKRPNSSAAILFTPSKGPNCPIEQAAQKAGANLMCLHGIRVITMIWMIVNHTYLFGGFFVLWAHRRLIDIADWPKSLSFQLVLNGWLTVETYFFLSATIIVLNVLPLMQARKFTYPTYIFHRLVRLLPAYAGLVCLNFLWPLVSSGPVWLVKGRSFIQTPCENYLWTNFLFINNWIWPEKQCMVHTWFLSADFQLYLLAPIIVYLLYRRPVFGHSVNIIVAVLASILSGVVIYSHKLMPATLINKLEFDSIKQQLSYSYFATYQHMGPYCLGIFTGYLLHKRPQARLPKHLTWLLWLLLPPLSFTTLLLTYLWNGAYDDPDLINPSPLVSALYVAIHRTIWTSLLAWIVFACATGKAKLMSTFLAHQMFVPISRLSFSIYLVHLPVIMFRALNLRHTIEWTDSNILWEACGNFIVSIIVGYYVNIVFESPIINLEQVLFGRPQAASGGGKSCKSSPQSEGARKGSREHLRPQSISVSGGDYQSDDNRSTDLSSNQAASSPEEERKAAPMVSSGEAANDLSPEPLAAGKLVAPAVVRSSKLNRLPMRRYSHERPPIIETSQGFYQGGQYGNLWADDDEHLGHYYPVGPTYRTLRRSHHENEANFLRPAQYATLARASRLELEPAAHHLYGRPIYAPLSQSSRSQIDGPVWGRHQSGGRQLEALANGSRRYDRRETNLEDWRNIGANLPPLPQVEAANSISEDHSIRQASMASASMLIPRIDSSTLRRKPAKSEEEDRVAAEQFDERDEGAL